MSKTMLIGVIAAAVLAVGTIAVVTATVVVDDEDDGGERVVQLAPAPVPDQGLSPLERGRGGRLFRFDRGVDPGPGPLRDLRTCLRKHGLARPNRDARPNFRTMREALKACRPTLPAPLPGRP